MKKIFILLLSALLLLSGCGAKKNVPAEIQEEKTKTAEEYESFEEYRKDNYGVYGRLCFQDLVRVDKFCEMNEDIKAEFIVQGIKAKLDSELFPPAYVQTEEYKNSYENMLLEGYNDYYAEALLDCAHTAKEFSSKGVESTIYGDCETTPGSYFCIIRTTPAKLKEIKDELDEDYFIEVLENTNVFNHAFYIGDGEQFD